MANDLSAVAQRILATARVLGNEPAGMLGAITINPGTVDGRTIAKGDTLQVPWYGNVSAVDFTPGNVFPDGVAHTASTTDLTILKSRKSQPRSLTAEEEMSLENGGINADWVNQWLISAMRTLRNECATDANIAADVGAGFAVGTAGVIPFASDLSALTAARNALKFGGGAPMADVSVVIGSAASTNISNLAIYQQAHQAGSDTQLRTGTFLPTFGMRIVEDANVTSHVAGAGTGYVIDGTGTLTAGTRTLKLKTGSGTILAGDVLTIESQPYAYVAASDYSSPNVTINLPGLKVATANGKTVTRSADHVSNIALERSALIGVCRPPRINSGGQIIGTMPVVDPLTGMTFLIVDILEYGQRVWELHLAWGFKAVNPEMIVKIMG